MLKKLCSVALALIMTLSLATSVFAEFFNIEGFEDGDTSAKQIQIYDNYAFVTAGSDPERPDAINVYDLANKKLIATYALPIYSTGLNYFANIAVVGDHLWVSWNKYRKDLSLLNRGSGDPVIRRYSIQSLIEGKFEHNFSSGTRGDNVFCLYGDMIFYTYPYNAYIYSRNAYTTGGSASIMTLPTKADAENILTLEASKDYFYITRKNEIVAYDTKDLYAQVTVQARDYVATYESEAAILDTLLYNENLYVTTEAGVEIFTIEGKKFKSIGKYTAGGKIMAMNGVDNKLYVYADGAKAIQILDITDLANIKVIEEFKVKNPQTLGVKDIAVVGKRVYAADLTEGFTMYSSNELDRLETEVEIKAESYAEELVLSPQGKAIELIVGLNIMNLRENGMFAPSLYITRGEFAQAASSLIGVNKNGSYATIDFTDVARDYAYSEGINALCNIGIMNGYTDGTFRPEDPILYEHAVTIMLKLLGYTPMLQNGESAVSVAGGIGILEKVSPMSSGYISRGDLARLIYNSLETKRMKMTSFGKQNEYNISKEDTLLAQMGIKKDKGQVIATEFTSLTGKGVANKDRVIINGVQHLEGTSGASSYLGRYITYYYDSNEGRNGEILFVIPSTNENVLTIDAKDISSETTANVFAYFDEDDRLQKEPIYNASVIFNGKYDPDYTAKDLKPADGEVLLVDSDFDGEIDVVIVRSYETFIVNGYGSGILKFKYGYSDINLASKSSSSEKMLIEVDGKGYDVTELDKIPISEWNVVSVVRSRDEKLIEIYANSRKVTGMATSRNEKTVKIGDEEFELSQSYLDNIADPTKDVPDFVVGKEYYAYIDSFGKIATVEICESSPVYGYLVAADKGDGLNSHIAELRILVRDVDDPRGVVKNFYSSEKFKVNGVITEDITTVPEIFVDGVVKKQIVKIFIDLEGRIKELYTAINKVDATIDGVENPDYDGNSYVGYTPGQFTYDATVSKSAAYHAQHFSSFNGCKYVPTVNTLVFRIVNSAEPSDKDYTICSPDQVFKAGYTAGGPLYIYDADEDFNVAAMVLSIGSSVETTTVGAVKQYAIIDEFRISLNADGEEKVTLISAKDKNGKATELVLKDAEIVDNQPDSTVYKGMKLVDLPKGSVIRYVKNSKGELTGVRILHIPSETVNYYEQDGTSVSLSNVPDCAFAKIIKRTSSNRLLYNAEGVRLNGGTLEGANRKWDRNMGLKSAVIYIYDKNTKKVSSASATDILPGDDALVVTRTYLLDLVVIYR